MTTQNMATQAAQSSKPTGTAQIVSQTEKVVSQCNTVMPDRLNIELNTPTDFWLVGANGLVGAAGLITAIAVAWITRINQKSQNRINKASFRQKWQEKFSDTSAKFLGLVSEIAIDTVMETKELEERKLLVTKRLPELMYLRETLLIMLDTRQPYTQEIRSEMAKTIQAIREVELKTLAGHLNELRKHFSAIHEKAWQDIQQDLRS